MSKYTITCPHLMEVKNEIGDWVTEGTRSYFKVEKVTTKMVPCRETAYMETDHNPFDKDSGLDPQGIEVKCKRCGKIYFLFPAVKVS